ncbi:hypothetical protein DL546_000488 [Coniochaeta pulveracea]|uniref:Alpha-ketoglutarate-dependent sulfonate dioxygenase n=1 Tax=Coniochaeta pulveracea TaxID=177199 RepID=A0A420YKL8_9PEZI|nr:hypothetical protein DL546_000488 [Coniochaeta pulveracea]
MVWHAHMLNPRAYLEDCMLAGLRALWHTGMPWVAVNTAIDNKFNYIVSDDVKADWVARTDHSWDNQDDSMIKSITCPLCEVPVEIPWTTSGLNEHDTPGREPGLVGTGYGDGNFMFMCPGCDVILDKKVLSVGKFVKDTEALMGKGRPMPGTVLDPVSGMPEVIPISSARSFPRTFPNRMHQQLLRSQVLDLVNPRVTARPDMDIVRSKIEAVLKSNATVKFLDGVSGLGRYRLHPKAGIAVRKMMARYWENFSPFALDLGGAVLRQGTFIEKMVKIDWLHSPSAAATMSRLLTKYQRFFGIMATNPKKTAVPTLDVDLAWHTHQLSPPSYYAYSVHQTNKFIDHDDKIEEGELNAAFEWTSKTYQEKYGEVYSECTCWYCETIRTTHISSVGKLLGASKNEKVAENFHSSGAASLCPPDNSAHISSHSAVKYAEGTTDTGRRRVRAHLAAAYQARLDDQYAKAKRRAEKKGRKIPPKDQYYDHWGYSYYSYGPYMYPLWFTPGLYYMWPPGYMGGCGAAGAWGACAAGSCGGGVAAGACGGPGGCGAGDGVGGCGSGGGCGGGGGGCGGGGGGCGGGGGGGGCGGGGGS